MQCINGYIIFDSVVLCRFSIQRFVSLLFSICCILRILFSNISCSSSHCCPSISFSLLTIVLAAGRRWRRRWSGRAERALRLDLVGRLAGCGGCGGGSRSSGRSMRHTVAAIDGLKFLDLRDSKRYRQPSTHRLYSLSLSLCLSLSQSLTLSLTVSHSLFLYVSLSVSLFHTHAQELYRYNGYTRNRADYYNNRYRQE